MTLRPTLVALALTAVALTGCTSEQAAKVKSSATADPSSIVKDGASPSESPSQTADATANLGDTVTVGDWDVKVTKVVLNADALVKQGNQFNDAPKGQYVLVTYQATYGGKQRTADVQSDLTWTFTGPNNRVVNQTFEDIPLTRNASTSARPGGRITYAALFDVAPAQLKGALVTVQGYDEAFNEVYADFGLN